MDDAPALPPAVLSDFRIYAGTLIGRELLGGMSLARVERLRGERGSADLKQAPTPVEFAFYTTVALGLRSVGVPIPALIGASAPGAPTWLLLEDVSLPLPAPSPDGQPDVRLLAALARLHRATRDASLRLPSTSQPPWSAGASGADITAALACFPAAYRAGLRSLLRRCVPRPAEARAGACWISGDPNPRNWGARADGSVALFGWELFQRGEPASDLAISVAGLGDRATFRAVAERYLALPDAVSDAPGDIDGLANAMAGQKVLTVVRVLASSTRGTAQPPPGLIATLVVRVSRWLEGLAA